MADNKALPLTGSGDATATVATDEIGGVDFQQVKLVDGMANSTTGIAAGEGAAANALRTTIASDSAVVGAVNEAAPGTDTASSGLNGRLQRIAQRLTSAIALLGGGLPSALSSDRLKVDGSGVTQPVSGTIAVTGVATEATLGARTGSLTETAPATDTASSGINGRLQRVAQRLTSMITLLGGGLPSALSSDRLKVDGSGVTQPISGSVAQSGTWTIQPGNTANTTAWKVDGSAVTQPVSGTVTANVGTGTRDVGGNVAHDAADIGNPVKIGGVARTANPTAVTGSDRVDATFDDLGRQVMVLSQVRDLVVHQHTEIASSSSEVTILTAGAGGVFHDIVALVLTNQTGTAVVATIKDGTGGTNRMKIALAANGGAVLNFPVPVPQGTAANNWTITLSNATTTVDVFVQAVKNV